MRLLTVFLLLGVILSACKEEEVSGSLSLQLGVIEEGKPYSDIADFNIAIEGVHEGGSTGSFGRYGDTPMLREFQEGTYTVTASEDVFGDVAYKGAVDFAIIAGEVADVQLNCVLSELKVHEGDVRITTQEEVVAFAATQTEVVKGDLSIEGEGIEDLDVLIGLRRVEGNLVIKSIAESDLGGLYQLNSISGDLLISENARMESISGLLNLRQVDGEISVDDSSLVEDLSNLNPLFL